MIPENRAADLIYIIVCTHADASIMAHVARRTSHSISRSPTASNFGEGPGQSEGRKV